MEPQDFKQYEVFKLHDFWEAELNWTQEAELSWTQNFLFQPI